MLVRRALLASSIVIALGLGTAGCNFISPVASLDYYAPSDGAQADIGQLKARNLISLQDKDANSGFVGAFANSGSKEITFAIKYTTAAGKTGYREFTVGAYEVLNFGYQGIMSLIDLLCSRHDVIVYDAESHACIIDGLRLHPGQRFVFKHNDVADCEKQLQRATALIEKNKAGGILLITEGVFGMAGDQGKLKEIAALRPKYEFRLLVDDAHGFGTLGKTGAGAGEEQGVQDEIDLYFSTFAKSMASIGAFIAGPKSIIDYVRYNIRSQIFAKSLPMPIVIGNLKRLELLRSQPQLKEKLWENALKLQNGLKEKGFDIGKTDSVVTPVYMKGGVEEATHMVTDLRENYNIFCSIVVYPVIPKGHIIYRLIPTAAHTDEDIQLTLKAFEETKKKLDEGAYKSEAIAQMAEA